MLAGEFIARNRFDDAARVILFCPGKSNPRAKEATWEPVLAERAVKKLTEALVEPGSEDMALTVFYADETPAGTIALESETYPFLVSRRVVIVRHAEVYNVESRADALLHYLQNPAETTTLALVAKQIDRRLKFFKACEKAGWIVECPEYEENSRELRGWVEEECRLRGKRIGAEAIRALVDRTGPSLGTLRNACENLCNYVGSATEITEIDIAAATADVAEEEVWALTDAIAASDTAKSIRSLHRLLSLGKDPNELLGIVNWLLKTAYQVAVPEAAPRPVSNFVAQKIRPLAEKLGREKLPAAFALLTDTQFMMRSTGVDSALAIELLVIKLATPRARRR